VTRAPHVVGLGGTTRAGSSTELALRHVLFACERRGATIRLFSGAELETLPLYAPERPDRTEGAMTLIAELRRADAVVLASSSYHGAVAGLVKNAIDYVQDMAGDARPYLSDRPVGCIATGAGWQGAVATLGQLRTIVHALRGWPTPLGVAINTVDRSFAPDGEILDAKVAVQLGLLVDDLSRFVARWNGADAAVPAARGPSDPNGRA